MPVLERTANTTIIKGCTYTSARNTSLHEFTYIKINEDVYTFANDDAHIQRENLFLFPDMIFDRRIDLATVSCIIQIPGESFTSNSSKLYQQPGWNIKVYIIFINLMWTIFSL